MIDIKKYNRIISFGCSWTSGDELKDHEILDLDFEECRRLKLNYGFKKFHNFRDKNNLRYGDLIDKNKTMNLNSSWTAKIAKKINLDFVNLAKGGTGIDEHFLEIFRFLKNDYNDNDLILLGLTNYTRVLKWPIGDSYTTILPDLFNFTPVPKKDLKWNLENLWTYNNLITNYLKTIDNILNLNCNIYVQFMSPGCNPKYEIEKGNLHHTVSDFLNYIEKRWNNRFLYNGYIENTSNDHCGFGHPSEQKHDDLANKILERF